MLAAVALSAISAGIGLPSTWLILRIIRRCIDNGSLPPFVVTAGACLLLFGALFSIAVVVQMLERAFFENYD